MRRSLPLLAVLAVLAFPASASAVIVPGEVVDGPSADVVALGEVDLARDGSGAVTYVKREGGVDHVFVARYIDGAFQPPERVDVGLPGASSLPVVAATAANRLAVAFVNGGVVHGVVKGAGVGYAAPVALGAGTRPSIDMSITGTAFVAFAGGGDVRLARLDRRTNAWVTLEAPADANPAAAAGNGLGRPRVAVSADGVALVAWGESGADGRSHVHARKVFGSGLSRSPQDLTLSGGDADSPDVGAEDDSSFAWVTFQQVTPTRRQVVARRQRGTEFDPPVALDAALGPEGAERPRIALNGRGEGLVALSGESTRTPVASSLRLDTFAPSLAVGPAVPGTAAAVPVLADNGDGLVAWAYQGGVLVREFDLGRPSPAAASVLRPEFGPLDPALGLDAATDRLGSVLVVGVQGVPGEGRLVAAALDRPPTRSAVYTPSQFRALRRPLLTWGASVDLWGGPTYRVELDGVVVAETRETRVTPGADLTEGVHRVRVLAIDRRGQVTAGRVRLVRVDTVAPRASATVRRRRVGDGDGGGGPRSLLEVRVAVRASDLPAGASSGVRSVRVAVGKMVVFRRRVPATIVVRTRSRARVAITVTDGARNSTQLLR